MVSKLSCPFFLLSSSLQLHKKFPHIKRKSGGEAGMYPLGDDLTNSVQILYLQFVMLYLSTCQNILYFIHLSFKTLNSFQLYTYGTHAKKSIKNLNEHACFCVSNFYTLKLFDCVVMCYPYYLQ